MARPPKPPNPIQDQIEALAAINCTWDEICSVTGVPIGTLKKKFGTNYRKGKEAGKTNLKKRMYEVAMSGNITMMIFLSKQMLGYADKVDTNTKIEQKLNINYKGVLGRELLPITHEPTDNNTRTLQSTQ